ncbi:MAG: class I SAM-dependent methyltransferase [Chloroflexota bacterium]|nr:class I SAM-dependent methyltransferase [Chloroflexota bacterium]
MDDWKQVVRAGYNSITQEYLKLRSETSADVTLLDDLLEQLPMGARVLDAGCGAGVPVTWVLGQRCNVIGLDLAEAQLRLARQLVQGVCLVCQDMTHLGFPDDTFDAICSYYAIIHVPRTEHRRLLLEFHRVLRPGSLMLVCMGLGDLENDVADYCGSPMYWSHYDGKTNLGLIQRCGFEVIWSRPVRDATDRDAAHLFALARKT